MNGDKLPLIAEAVITDLLAKNARLEEEIEYLRNELASMRTGPQSKLLEENRNLRHELAVLVHGIDAESERLREQLVASCAREAQLREALVTATTVIEPYVWSKEEALIASAIALPHDDTALREYRRKVLLEAAGNVNEYGGAAFVLRRMAEEE